MIPASKANAITWPDTLYFKVKVSQFRVKDANTVLSVSKFTQQSSDTRKHLPGGGGELFKGIVNEHF